MPPNPNGLTSSISEQPKKSSSSKKKHVHFSGKDEVQTFEKQGEYSALGHLISKLFFWSEDQSKNFDVFWNKLPTIVGQVLVLIATFIFGLSVRGDWVIFAVYLFKYIKSFGGSASIEESEDLINSVEDWFNVRLKGYWNTFFWSALISYVTYFGVGGFLHWYYYVRQKDRPEDWKCQPKKWLSPELELHEIKVGSISLVFGSALSAVISTYVQNGGTALWMYLRPEEYGYIWLVVQIPIVFMYQDYLTYWHHRMYHTPWLYKNFHKLHHTYKQPTAFSVTAIHPVEFVHMQFVLLSILFIVPVFWLNYVVIISYVYYHGIIDHSGINFKRYWWQPWQPDCIFHDNHHQYFHVNFGFNVEYWDHLHGTYRQKDRIYHEDIYYGQGKSIDEASEAELQTDIQERESENPKAYQGDKYEFGLDKNVINKKLKTAQQNRNN